MAVAGAGEVPVLAYITIGLLAAVAWVVCLGLRSAWQYTFGFILSELASVRIPIPFGHDIHPLRQFDAINNTVLNALHDAAQKSEHAMGYLFHGAAVIQGWMAREIVGIAEDVYGWGSWLQNVHLPRWGKALLYATFPPALIARLIKAGADAHLPRITRTIVVREIPEVVTRVKRIAVASAGAVPIPGWVIHLPKRVGRLEREVPSIWKRLRRVERLAGATGAVALMLIALRKLGLNWVRCRNVGRFGKRVCGMDGSLLDTLLTDSLAIISVLSVVEFANELRAVEDEALAIVGRLVREWPS